MAPATLLPMTRYPAVAPLQSVAASDAKGLAFLDVKATEEGVIATGSGLLYKVPPTPPHPPPPPPLSLALSLSLARSLSLSLSLARSLSLSLTHPSPVPDE